MLQGEIGSEQTKQSLFCSLEHDPDEPLQVRQPGGNNTLCTQQLQSLLDQRDRTVAFHRQGKQLAGEPQVLSPPTLAELIFLADLIQVLIHGVVTITIAGKSGSWHLHLICNRPQHAAWNARYILQGASGET